MDPCIATAELRVFVSTWNVVGRSPVGSLAVDVDEWLNLKEAADIYILGQIFWFGDLNYRLYLEDNLARLLIQQQNWGALQEFDQLRRELENGGVFQSWEEGNIEFAPTYKYSSSNRNRYSGGIPSRAGEKHRTPA